MTPVKFQTDSTEPALLILYFSIATVCSHLVSFIDFM